MAILEISVPSQKRRGKLCYLYYNFVRQLYVEIDSSHVTPLYSSGGHSNMVAVGFCFPKIDTRSSPILSD